MQNHQPLTSENLFSSSYSIPVIQNSMAYSLEAMEISIWLVAEIKQWTSPYLPTEDSFVSSEIIKGFLILFYNQWHGNKGLCRTLLKDSAARMCKLPCEISSSQCEGTRCICKCSRQYLAFLQLFLQEVGQHWAGLPRRHRAAELLGWLRVPGWGRENELNKVNKECLASLFSSLIKNKDLQLQILWASEHRNGSREECSTFCTSGTSRKVRNLRTGKVNVHVSSMLFFSLSVYLKGHFRPQTLFGPN